MFKSSRLNKHIKSALKSVATNDSGSGFNAKMFELQEVSRYGIGGKVVGFAFDPIQSLLALATDSGEVHVFGKQQVEVVFTLNVKVITFMKFVKGIYLIIVDSSDCVIVLSLYSKSVLTSFFASGKITCIEADPSLDWMFIGLQSGSTLIYDIDRDIVSSYKIGNLQKSLFFSREPLSPVVSIQWNPRDIGQILICYELVAVIYSLVDNEVKQHFIYKLPPFAPGGCPDANIEVQRIPKLIQALYHPNSLHILTVHQDNSMVFWDAHKAKLLQARTIFDVNVNIPKSQVDTNAIKSDPIIKVSWICEENPEKTSLLIAGGSSDMNAGCQALTMIDLGTTPKYSITSYEKMGQYYSNPVKQVMFSVCNSSTVVDFLPLAKSSYFNGNHDPHIILVLLENGELQTLLYPSGHITHKASLFPQSMSWIRPSTTTSVAFSVPAKLWLGLMASTYNKDYFLKGGTPVKKVLRRPETRTAIATGHTNGFVRIWDASHEELDESSVFEINVANVLNYKRLVSVEKISFAAETAELAVSVESGDVVFFKFKKNSNYNTQGNDLESKFNRFSISEQKQLLIDVSDRVSSKLKEGFCPIAVVHANIGKVSALTNSNIGFLGIAYDDGSIFVVDRRGPAIIYMEHLRKLDKHRSSYISKIEFFVMTYGDDPYSSILMVCGTDLGQLIIFKILPDSSGRFSVQPVDSLRAIEHGPITNIESFSRDGNIPCKASIQNMQALSKGIQILGSILVSGPKEIKILNFGRAKDHHRVLKYPIATAGCCFFPSNSDDTKTADLLVVAIEINSQIKLLSPADLKEIKSLIPATVPQTKYIKGSSLLFDGDVVLRIGKSEALLYSIKNTISQHVNKGAQDTNTLYNPNLSIPNRPQLGSLQRVLTTAYISHEELNVSLGGDRRPPSKYQESAIAARTLSPSSFNKRSESQFDKNVDDSSDLNDSYYQTPVKYPTNRGYSSWRSLTRSVQNGLDYVENSVNEYAMAANKQVNETIEKTRTDLVKGAFKSKLGI
ncbi:uncharacterized protein Ecym_4653 [Eremothecium cymbalariae DBVPG|uniref:Lethal giant larvae (Lgl)-like C-terminal domain-containing protein n=1 Tax=Eremothecium cymbalariae (strain CBS 270.75 / DBVPG 7215 / KCTC 17166 / NRRL Y-17582) TaxID=931890 RepID=G8JSF3_ERECY|nr:hypothetical protein Ecym_4653 [Eremothecium cymbalariae DBVPG\